MSKTKRRRRQADEFVHYVVTVSNWEHSYIFGVSGGRHFETGRYSEFASLELAGEVIRPEGFRYPRAIVTLSARPDMHSEPADPPASAIGMLNGREDILDAYVSVPADRMAELLSLAASGRIRAVILGGTRLKWRRGVVRSIQLETEFDEEDY